MSFFYPQQGASWLERRYWWGSDGSLLTGTNGGSWSGLRMLWAGNWVQKWCCFEWWTWRRWFVVHSPACRDSKMCSLHLISFRDPVSALLVSLRAVMVISYLASSWPTMGSHSLRTGIWIHEGPYIPGTKFHDMLLSTTELDDQAAAAGWQEHGVVSFVCFTFFRPLFGVWGAVLFLKKAAPSIKLLPSYFVTSCQGRNDHLTLVAWMQVCS